MTKLASTQTLSGTYNYTITPGATASTGHYFDPTISLTSTAKVAPATVGADGVFSAVNGVNLTMDGYGYISGAAGSAGTAAGIGIDLTGSSIVTINAPSQGIGPGLHGVVGGDNFYGAGGAGISMTGGGQLTNDAGIFGGFGYSTTGAAGVVAGGGTVVTNNGYIRGGGTQMTGGSDGAGVQLTGGAQLVNNGQVHGYSADMLQTNSGIGVTASGDSTYVKDNAGIYGGTVNGANVVAVSAGAGVQLSNDADLVVTGTGNIHGGKVFYAGTPGTYAAGSVGGNAADIYSGATLTVEAGGYLRGGGGATLGAGAYIDGGTLVNDGGVVQAGQNLAGGNVTNGNAVEFGPKGGELVVAQSDTQTPFFGGAIAGFGANDTIDAKDWSASGTSATFTSSTYQLYTADGTLNFTGLTPGGSFVFKSDGSGGTDITLAGQGGATVNQQIVIGSAAYPSPLVLGAGGSVYTVLPSGDGGVTAVVTNQALSTLTVNANGSITGGGASSAGGVFFAGNGVTLGQSNVTVNTGGTITGGYGDTGAKGGVGVDITSTQVGGITALTNDGVIAGGAGNLAGGGGVFFSSLVSSTNQSSDFINGGTVTGGSAFAGARFGNPSVGGYGVTVDLSQDQVQNSGVITGGPGGAGGGTGLIVEYGASAVNELGGAITGGTASTSSIGGIGVELLGGGIVATHGLISGGGGEGGTTGDAVTFNYVPGASTNLEELRIYQNASFNGDIAGFGQPGSYVDIGNWAKSGTSAAFTSSTVTLDTSDGNLTFTGLTVGDHFTYSQFGVSGTSIQVACFRLGTRIRCERGEVPIETLRIGDAVTTMSGSRAVRWIGRRSYSAFHAAGNRDVLPVRFHAGALGEQLPQRDLWVSPEHAMWFDGMLIPARALVNGTTIRQDTTAQELTYLHLEFDSHEVIYAEGALSESFVDDDSRAQFDNAAEYRALVPGPARPVRFCAPRVEEGEALESVRERLRAPSGLSPAPGWTVSPQGCSMPLHGWSMPPPAGERPTSA